MSSTQQSSTQQPKRTLTKISQLLQRFDDNLSVNENTALFPSTPSTINDELTRYKNLVSDNTKSFSDFWNAFNDKLPLLSVDAKSLTLNLPHQ